MTGAEIITFFRQLVDDESISDELGLNLLNSIKTIVEEERNWKMLLTRDTSLSFSTSENYTDAKSLPSGFSVEHNVKLVDSSNNEDEYHPVDYVDLLQYKDVSGRYAIDYANNNLYVCGTVGKDKTIYLFYFAVTDELIATAESPSWPARFHKLMAYRMAEMWLEGIDADTLTRIQWPSHKKTGDLLYKGMVRWDTRLWLKSMDSRAGFASPRVYNRDNAIDL